MNSWKDFKENILRKMTPEDRREWEQQVRDTTDRLTREMDKFGRLDSNEVG